VIEGGKDDDVDPNEQVGVTGRKKREGLLGALTAREHQVLEKLLEGLTNNEIGEALGIAEVTVKLHVRQIYQKIGAKNRAQAVKIVLTQRWRQ
jgi:DNA-binding NarL/FixJ family response regulator